MKDNINDSSNYDNSNDIDDSNDIDNSNDIDDNDDNLYYKVYESLLWRLHYIRLRVYSTK